MMKWIIWVVWIITSFVIVVDMFKKDTATGCLGLLLIPIVPFIWVFKGYSGNKKKAGTILYGSAIFAFSIIGYQWFSASSELKPFQDASLNEGIDFSLKSISTVGREKYYTVVAANVYDPNSEYASVDEMLSLIRDEKIESIAEFYPPNLADGTIIKVALPTSSGFVAVFEITGPNEIRKSYVTTYDNL